MGSASKHDKASPLSSVPRFCAVFDRLDSLRHWRGRKADIAKGGPQLGSTVSVFRMSCSFDAHGLHCSPHLRSLLLHRRSSTRPPHTQGFPAEDCLFRNTHDVLCATSVTAIPFPSSRFVSRYKGVVALNRTILIRSGRALSDSRGRGSFTSGHLRKWPTSAYHNVFPLAVFPYVLFILLFHLHLPH